MACTICRELPSSLVLRSRFRVLSQFLVLLDGGVSASVVQIKQLFLGVCVQLIVQIPTIHTQLRPYNTLVQHNVACSKPSLSLSLELRRKGIPFSYPQSLCSFPSPFSGRTCSSPCLGIYVVMNNERDIIQQSSLQQAGFFSFQALPGNILYNQVT